VPKSTSCSTGSIPREPITASTAPLVLRLGAPVRFMQTEIMVLPLDPHGPLRALHERIRAAGLPYARARFAFTPHITLNFYRTLTRDERREVLAYRPSEPAHFERLVCSFTNDPQPATQLLELPLLGGTPDGPAAERSQSEPQRQA
jgi:hypothetical protein